MILKAAIARLRRGARCESGSTIVEFAFAAPVTLLLIFAVVDFGRALFVYDLVANDARLGSRYAIVRGAEGCAAGATDCPLTSAILQQHLRNLSPGIDTTKLTVTLSYANTTPCPKTTTVAGAKAYPSQNGPGCIATVTVKYPFNFAALPFAQVPMTSTSQMTIAE